jgi:hypothetical protein
VWIKSIHAFTGGVACKDNTSVVDKLVELGYKDILVIEPELNQELIRELKDREFKVDALSVDDMLTDEVKSTPLRYEVILCLDVLNCLPPWFGVPLLDRLTAMDYKYLAINHCESILENRSPGLVRKSINSSDTSMSLKRQKTSRPAEYEPPFLRPDTPEAPSL